MVFYNSFILIIDEASSSRNTGVIAGSVVAGTIVVIIAMVLLWRYVRRRTQNGKLIWTKILQFLLKCLELNILLSVLLIVRVYVVGKLVELVVLFGCLKI